MTMFGRMTFGKAIQPLQAVMDNLKKLVAQNYADSANKQAAVKKMQAAIVVNDSEVLRASNTLAKLKALLEG